ncbi:MAG: TrmH family RNA methyltransferase [Roseiflexaceae bacterium]
MIQSTANPQVRFIRSLRDDRSLRRSERMFVLEGVRLVGDVFSSGQQPQFVLYDPEQLQQTTAGQALLALLTRHNVPQSPTTAAVIKSVSDTNSPQGVVAIARWPELTISHQRLVVVCDEIQDPGNLGTIIRSADAVGVDAIYCTIGSVDAFAPKTVRASMGSIMRVPIRTDMSWDAIMSALRGVTVYAADGGSTSQPHTAIDWSQPSALIVGNEARGLGVTARTVTNHFVHIPMRSGIESLNAAMATTIMLFEAQRQRLANN